MCATAMCAPWLHTSCSAGRLAALPDDSRMMFITFPASNIACRGSRFTSSTECSGLSGGGVGHAAAGSVLAVTSCCSFFCHKLMWLVASSDPVMCLQRSWLTWSWCHALSITTKWRRPFSCVSKTVLSCVWSVTGSAGCSGYPRQRASHCCRGGRDILHALQALHAAERV